MLPAPLRLLLKLQTRARLRRLVRGAKTLKGALYLLVMAGMFAMWLGPSLVFGFIGERAEGEAVRAWLSTGLMGYCLLMLISMGPDSGIQFHPAEIDFLFPAPFQRRELLIYRLTGMGLGCLLMALFFSTFLLRFVTTWLAAYVGILLALWFVVLLQTSVALVIALVAESAYTRVRRLAIGVIATALLLTALYALRRVEGVGMLEVLGHLRATWGGRIVLAPFEVFSRTITARSFVPEFLGWGAAALGIDALLALIVIRIDANFTENSIKASQKIYERLQQARRGGALATLVQSRDVRRRVPPLPWLGGAGPIAWRQFTTALRSSRGLAIIVGLISLAMLAPMLIVSNVNADRISPVFFVMPIVMLSVFFLPQMLQFDFRGDIDRLDVLKSLPLPPSSIVLGQLITPVLMATIIQLAMLFSIAAATAGWTETLTAICLLLPLTNVLVFGVENLMFLLFPTRTTAIGTGDMQAVGRQMLMMIVKLFILLLTGALAAAAGGLAWLIAGRSNIALLVGSVLAILTLGAAIVPGIGWAFCRFDPSRDIPD